MSRVNCGSVPRLWSISVRLGGELSCWKNPSRITAPTPSDFRYGSRSDTPECETHHHDDLHYWNFTAVYMYLANIQFIFCAAHTQSLHWHFTCLYHTAFILYLLSIVEVLMGHYQETVPLVCVSMTNYWDNYKNKYI